VHPSVPIHSYWEGALDWNTPRLASPYGNIGEFFSRQSPGILESFLLSTGA
jgi:hypothetical protein